MDKNMTREDWAILIANAYALLVSARERLDDLSVDLAESGLNDLLQRYHVTLVTGNKRRALA